MAKEVKLRGRIDKNGDLHVKPEGTQGEECVDLMEFINHIPGLVVVETTRVDTDSPSQGNIHGVQGVG
jgi:hypothetical protein